MLHWKKKGEPALEQKVPDFLHQLLVKQYGAELSAQIESGFFVQRSVTLRSNSLKTNPASVSTALTSAAIAFRKVSWNDSAFIADGAREGLLRELPAYKNGEIYLQSLSSMIPPIVLNPKAGESVLDMAAAPGGKTTQMAAMTNGRADITACEKNKIRAERLRYNLVKQGAGRVSVMVCDARKLDDLFSFDKVLLDAPCSGSGTFGPYNTDFTEDLYRRSQRFQTELLRKALRLLKPGHRMVYSTCSVLSGENEDILRHVLPEFGAKVVPIPEDAFLGAPRLPSDIPGTLCIRPNELYEGFFVAQIEKP